MKRAKKAGKIAGVSTLVAVVLALFSATYLAGKQVEQIFREGVDLATENGADVSIVDYQRGLFGATARTDVVFRVPSAEDPTTLDPVTVPFIHSIRHGPLATLSLAAAARVHSEAQPVEDNMEQVKEVFGGDKLPVLDAVIGWAGGLNLLHVVSPKIETTVKGLTFKNDITLVEGFKRVFTGTASFMLDELQFWEKKNNGAIRVVQLENFRITVDTSVKDGVMDTGTLKFEVDKIITEGEEKEVVDSLKLAFQLENIDAKAMDVFLQTMLEYQEEQDQEQEQEQELSPEQTIALFLQRKPVFSIQEASAVWPEGAVAGSFRIAYVGDGNLNASFENNLSSLSSDLKMELPRTLVIRHINSQVSKEIDDALEDGEESEVNVEKEKAEQAGKQIAMLLEKGIFVEKGKALSVEGRLRNGELNLNGKPQPLEILFELIPPFILN